MRENFSIRLSQEESDWLRQKAKEQGRTAAGLLRWILNNYREEVIANDLRNRAAPAAQGEEAESDAARQAGGL